MPNQLFTSEQRQSLPLYQYVAHAYQVPYDKISVFIGVLFFITISLQGLLSSVVFSWPEAGAFALVSSFRFFLFCCNKQQTMNVNE
jgi:hypothetical protein